MPLVLLHGFAQTPKSWQTTIEHLPAGLDVQAIELPGHGETGLNFGEPSVEMVREFVASRIERPSVVWGYSQGARVAYDLVLNSDAPVRGLVVESGAPGIADEVARADRRSRDFALSSRIESAPIEDFVAMWEKVPALGEQSAHLIDAQREDRLAQDPVALAAALRGIGQAAYEPMWDRLGEIEVPVLLLCGERDVVYTRHAEAAAAALPDSEAVVVEGASHAVHLAQPALSAAAVAQFMALRF